MPTHAFLDHSGPIAFAHRGGAAGGLENTMVAFQASVDLGYRYIETDVHVTRDGVLVAFHDESLDRATDRIGLIRELTWSEVSAARVGGVERIPRFDDVLATWPDLRINVDPKHDSAVQPLADALIRADSVSRVLVGAFSDARIAAVRRLCGPDLATALGPRSVARLRSATAGRSRSGRDAVAVQVPVKYSGIPVTTPRFVTRAHRAGLAVHVWTIDDPAEMNRLLDMGVDGIMTDRPDVLKDVLTSRGEWPDPAGDPSSSPQD